MSSQAQNISGLLPNPPKPAIIKICWGAVGLIAVGLLVSLLASGLAAKEVRASALAVLYISELAALAAGFLGGFLFGIPKVLQSSDPVTGTKYRQKVNTNLEEISDWLTKIIIGLGLIELKDLVPWIWKASLRLSQSFSTDGSTVLRAAPAFSSAIVYFSILGFLLGYLMTRLYFSIAFAEADNKSYDQGEANATDARQPKPPTTESAMVGSVNPNAQKILATLAQNQAKLFGDDPVKRWTFQVSPNAVDYVTYMEGLSELLMRGLVAVLPENNHIMLSDYGLAYVKKHPEELADAEIYRF